MNLIEDKNKLEKKYKDFLADADVSRLELLSEKPNVFKILKLENYEIRHSNFLAWLLDPNESHGLGDLFMKRFLRDIFHDSDHSLLLLEETDLGSIIVLREYENIDILIEADKFVIVIENKVYSSEHSKQLDRYKNLIEKRYTTHFGDPSKKLLFVYLTPDNDEPTNGSYIKANYGSIEYYVQELLDLYKDRLSEATLAYLNDYINIIRDDILGNGEVTELSKRIYKRHRALIDTIFEVKEDSTSIIKRYIEDWVQSKEYITGTENKSFVRFLPKDLDEIMPKRQSGWKDNESFLFEVHINYYGGKKIRTYATVSCGDEEVVNILEPPLKNYKPNKGKKWRTHSDKQYKFDVNKWAMEDEDTIRRKIYEIMNDFDRRVQEITESILSDNVAVKKLQELKKTPL